MHIVAGSIEAFHSVFNGESAMAIDDRRLHRAGAHRQHRTVAPRSLR